MNAQRINQRRALNLMQQHSGKLIDVRSPVQYRDSHIDGSTNMSLRQITQLIKLPRDTPVVFLDGGDVDPKTLESATNSLFVYGFKSIFKTSLQEWK